MNMQNAYTHTRTHARTHTHTHTHTHTENSARTHARTHTQNSRIEDIVHLREYKQTGTEWREGVCVCVCAFACKSDGVESRA